MNRNIVFGSFLFALAILLTAGYMSSRNLSADDIHPSGLQVGSEAQQSSDQDASITSAIRLKFASDEVVSAANIHVDTSGRSVRLVGVVASQIIADRAVQLGRSVDGVKTVRSQLIVRTEKS